MRYLEYKIVEEVDIERFERVINELIRDGWEPHGQLIILPRHENEIADGLFSGDGENRKGRPLVRRGGISARKSPPDFPRSLSSHE